MGEYLKTGIGSFGMENYIGSPKQAEMNLKKLGRYFTRPVTIFFIIGLFFIIGGETDMAHYWFPEYIPTKSPLNTILRTVGAALVGSGVFTAIIKSSEYTQIFSNVISEIIWSKKYIDRRADKREIWSKVSKSLYEEKFPAISDEIEDIIADKYFPTQYNFYIQDEEFTMNICNIQDHPEFWKQDEILKLTIIPTNANEEIEYKIGGDIDPPGPGIEDITEFKVHKVTVNNNPINTPISPAAPQDGKLTHLVSLTLKGETKYEVFYQRTKVVCKKTNPDKRFFGKYICHNLKVTAILEATMDIILHRAGSLQDFVKEPEQVNNGVKIQSWRYDGLLLPNQGFIAILK